MCEFEEASHNGSINDENSAASIFKLNADCFEELLEYLSLKELHSLAQTCRRMQQIAGSYYQRTFTGINMLCKNDCISVGNILNLNGLDHFVQTISIHNNLEQLDYVAANCHSLREITFLGVEFTAEKIECIIGILANVETIKIRGGIIRSDLHDGLLQYCPQLKQLSLHNLTYNSKTPYAWLYRKYPRLESMELFGKDELPFNLLEIFLNINSGIKRFSTGAKRLMNFQMNSNVHIDTLTVICDMLYWDDAIIKQLNHLYDGGFYKRLFWNGLPSFPEQENIDRMALMKSLEILRCGRCMELDFSSLSN